MIYYAFAVNPFTIDFTYHCVW